MYILITYDVATDDKAGQRRLRQVARACENIGQRVQNSVFECELAPAQLVDIRNKLLKIIDNESDSLRIYHMGSNWHHKIEQLGKEKSFDISGPLIIYKLSEHGLCANPKLTPISREIGDWRNT